MQSMLLHFIQVDHKSLERRKYSLPSLSIKIYLGFVISTQTSCHWNWVKSLSVVGGWGGVGVQTSYLVTPTWVEVGLDWIELKLS